MRLTEKPNLNRRDAVNPTEFFENSTELVKYLSPFKDKLYRKVGVNRINYQDFEEVFGTMLYKFSKRGQLEFDGVLKLFTMYVRYAVYRFRRRKSLNMATDVDFYDIVKIVPDESMADVEKYEEAVHFLTNSDGYSFRIFKELLSGEIEGPERTRTFKLNHVRKELVRISGYTMHDLKVHPNARFVANRMNIGLRTRALKRL